MIANSFLDQKKNKRIDQDEMEMTPEKKYEQKINIFFENMNGGGVNRVNLSLFLVGTVGCALIFLVPGPALSQEAPAIMVKRPFTIRFMLASLNDTKIFFDPGVSKFEKVILAGKYFCCTAGVTFGQVAHLLPAGYSLPLKNALNVCCASSWASYTAFHMAYPGNKIFQP